MAEKLKGIRKRGVSKQIHSQIKIAADALLTVMHLLNRERPSLTEEGRQYLDCVGRRAEWIEKKLKSTTNDKDTP